MLVAPLASLPDDEDVVEPTMALLFVPHERGVFGSARTVAPVANQSRFPKRQLAAAHVSLAAVWALF